MILFMIKGRLPWYGPDSGGANNTINANTKQDIKDNSPSEQNIKSSTNMYNAQYFTYFQTNSELLEIKRKISYETLFKGVSFELIDIMYYIQTLSFYEKPDYQFLKKKLFNALEDHNCEDILNGTILYDWSQREAIDYDIYRDLPRLRLQQFQNETQEQIADKDKSKSTSHIHFDQNSPKRKR